MLLPRARMVGQCLTSPSPIKGRGCTMFEPPNLMGRGSTLAERYLVSNGYEIKNSHSTKKGGEKMPRHFPPKLLLSSTEIKHTNTLDRYHL